MTSTTIEAASGGSRGKKWLGVLLSACAPGLGLVRGGHVARGLCWFLSIHAAAILWVLLATRRTAPSWVVIAGFVAILLGELVGLVDSYRPGRTRARVWLVALLFAVLASWLVAAASHQIGQSFVVPTGGMEPTLHGPAHGAADQIFVDRLAYRAISPVRGDLVTIRLPPGAVGGGGALYVRRLVGLPGETIIIRDGHLFADGRQLGEGDGLPRVNYVSVSRSLDASVTGGVYLVPPGAYLFLGDNSAGSLDGRVWGALPVECIYGRVARIYYPFPRCGIVPR